MDGGARVFLIRAADGRTRQVRPIATAQDLPSTSPRTRRTAPKLGGVDGPGFPRNKPSAMAPDARSRAGFLVENTAGGICPWRALGSSGHATRADPVPVTRRWAVPGPRSEINLARACPRGVRATVGASVHRVDEVPPIACDVHDRGQTPAVVR